ncbi:hypothetical protein EUGRSUZ_F03467 [Eucalyptus grandis]|uniref:Uncharacterized protein n=2 Tax=Eucalyptus grandis TaxID=71139 RepID=A0ACC3KLD2_EUCGR|nr:hypothetical protein EUGRSUZ_F03467 [Eucalyptus grandis]
MTAVAAYSSSSLLSRVRTSFVFFLFSLHFNVTKCLRELTISCRPNLIRVILALPATGEAVLNQIRRGPSCYRRG